MLKPRFDEYERMLTGAPSASYATEVACPACGEHAMCADGVAQEALHGEGDTAAFKRTETFRCRVCGYAVDVSETVPTARKSRTVTTVCPGRDWSKSTDN